MESENPLPQEGGTNDSVDQGTTETTHDESQPDHLNEQVEEPPVEEPPVGEPPVEEPPVAMEAMNLSLKAGPSKEETAGNVTPENLVEEEHHSQLLEYPEEGAVVIYLEETTMGSDRDLEVYSFTDPTYDPDESGQESGNKDPIDMELLEDMFRKRKRIVWEEGRPLVCPVCQKDFKNLTGLKGHVRRHYEAKSHSCPMCGKMFFRLGDCKRHQKSCEERPYRCEFCIQCFSTEEEWREHSSRHESQPGHKCDLCGAIYLHQRSLKQHMNQKHSEHLRKAEEEKAATSMECQHCQEVFGDVEKFRHHMDNSHTDMESKVPFQKYKCSFCPQVFSTLRGQRVHLRVTHLNDLGAEECKKKPYQCELCGKMMSMKNAEYHQRTHTKERPFKCETCGKGFASKQNLKEHQRVHTKEKPFKCRYCPSSFTASGTRVRHERKHTGEMPYICTFCGKRFRALSGFEVHERTHTGVTPYQCRYCPKTFTYNNKLREHEKSGHPDVYKPTRYGVEVQE